MTFKATINEIENGFTIVIFHIGGYYEYYASTLPKAIGVVKRAYKVYEKTKAMPKKPKKEGLIAFGSFM